MSARTRQDARSERTDGHPGPALVITDGSIAGFLCCWAEGIVRPPQPSRPPDGADHGGPVAWIDPRATVAGAAAARRAVAECQLVAALPGWVALGEHLPPSMPGLRESGILLAATLDALRRGLSRIVWPIQIGQPGADQPSLDAIADAFDRGLLAARLLSVDAKDADLHVETPLVDLSDTQMMDLAADMDAPLAAGAAWWCHRHAESEAAEAPCGQCVSCRRWTSAVRSVGLTWEDLGSQAAVPAPV